jgi:hypothetical protein
MRAYPRERIGLSFNLCLIIILLFPKQILATQLSDDGMTRRLITAFMLHTYKIFTGTGLPAKYDLLDAVFHITLPLMMKDGGDKYGPVSTGFSLAE